jgi:hypothetical protein
MLRANIFRRSERLLDNGIYDYFPLDVPLCL